MAGPSITNGASTAPTPHVQKTIIDPAASTISTGDTAWSTPGPAASDLRSDTITTPTAAMLSAIASCSLRDDVFNEDTTTTHLESYIAELTGKPAALLVLSGTMGNQLSLRSHLGGPPHSVVTDTRSHVYTAEAGGVASLSGALLLGVIPANKHHMTLEDVQKHAIISDDVHTCPTRVVELENTLAGTVMPLAEARRITEWCAANNIITHLDGARLWEVVAAGGGSLREHCALFDSVSLCFSKGLGAPVGSIIVGTEAFIKRARHLRKSIGGGMRQTGIIAGPALVSVQHTFEGGLLAATHDMARRVARSWQDLGGKLANPVETNMVWLDLEACGLNKQRWIQICKGEGITVLGGRLVIHYQVTEDTVIRLEKAMRKVFDAGQGNEANGTHNHGE